MFEAEALSKLLEQDRLLIVPGAYDALSAKLVERVGFAAAYITSYGISATELCQPDVGLITMSEIVQKVEYICQAVKIPIIVDGEAGFGNAVNIKRFVEEVERGGGSGTDIQDQRSPRIHHLKPDQKELVPLEEHVKKIRAAVEARRNHSFIIIGRTEAADIDEAIRRAKAYAEAGADMIFPHSKFSVSELEMIAEEVKMPMMLNYPLIMSEQSHRPTVSELRRPWFRIVLFPVSTLLASIKTSIRVLERIKMDGTDVHCDMATFEDVDEIVGVENVRSWTSRYMPSMEE